MWTPQRGEKSMEQSIAGLHQTELYFSKIEILMQEKHTQDICSEGVTENVGQSFK